MEADTYFCPERHGTYFGGFYMKDMPAMGKRDYDISTAITGDSGETFLKLLNAEQRGAITAIIPAQRNALKAMVAKVSRTLTAEQRAAFTKLRNLDGYRSAPAYLYSQPLGTLPGLPDTDFLFGTSAATQSTPTSDAAPSVGARTTLALREVADGGPLPKACTGDGGSATYCWRP